MLQGNYRTEDDNSTRRRTCKTASRAQRHGGYDSLLDGSAARDGGRHARPLPDRLSVRSRPSRASGRPAPFCRATGGGRGGRGWGAPRWARAAARGGTRAGPLVYAPAAGCCLPSEFLVRSSRISGPGSLAGCWRRSGLQAFCTCPGMMAKQPAGSDLLPGLEDWTAPLFPPEDTLGRCRIELR